MLREKEPTLPGVYWEDNFPTRKTALLTGVPVFLGVCPQDKKDVYLKDQKYGQELHLWPQFVQHYTKTTAESYMAAVVQGFFENGGRDCVVYWLKDKTNEALKEGLTAIQVWDNVDLICAPDCVKMEEKSATVEQQRLILEACAKSGDRFAILDAPNGANDDVYESEIQKAVRDLKESPGSDYGAFYGPWLKTIEGQKPVPPCGHVAGIYAASDRAEVPRSPANIALEGVVDVQRPQKVQTELAKLDIDNVAINSIRSLRGRGVRIWGARTLSSAPEWCYINVRRLAIMIQRWVNLNLAQVAFEPNDMRLWLRIERELNAYLTSLWQRGYLQGTTSDKAFRVTCDEETNPPEKRDQGQVVTYIAIAPTVPNEFIRVRLIHGETGVALATA